MKAPLTVSRSTYQKLAEENKRLLKDIKELVGEHTAERVLVVQKWREKFEEDNKFNEELKAALLKSQERGFFAKSDRHSIETMTEIFKKSDRYVYFIEDLTTGLWLKTETYYTSDPLEAMSFPSHISALTYVINNGIRNFEITEHEFVGN